MANGMVSHAQGVNPSSPGPFASLASPKLKPAQAGVNATPGSKVRGSRAGCKIESDPISSGDNTHDFPLLWF